MPCIWGKHDGSQAFLTVALFDNGVTDRILSVGSGHSPPLHVFNALIDSGAQATCITRRAAEKVGLLPIGMVPILGVSGPQYHNNYLFKLGFAFGKAPNPHAAEVATVHIFDGVIEGAELGAAGARFDVLLGMDVIGSGSLKIDGDGSFSFSF